MTRPRIDLESGAVGPMRLGDPPADAQAMGAPRRTRKTGGGGTVLEFEGFQLEFHEGRLACAAFDLGDMDRVTVGDFTLTRATTPLDMHVWLGDPASDSTDGGKLRWVDFERPGATLALEFEDGKLKYVQLYADGYA